MEEEALSKTEAFDMVVLSTGFRVSQTTTDLMGTLGIELNLHHFAETDHFNSVMTSRPGIYVCGVIESPKDIPHAIENYSNEERLRVMVVKIPHP